MTVSEAIKQWLYGFPKITIDERIETELLGSQAVSYAISRTPQNVIETYVDGSQQRTEYYMLFARQSTQLEAERVSNDKLLEELESWIEEKNLNGEYPTIDEKRIVDEIGISSSFYIYSQEEEESIYSLTIMIKYRKEL